MNLTAWLDVAIGLVVVYLGASLFVTIIGEYVSQLFNLRGRALRHALVALVDATAPGEPASNSLAIRLKKNPALKPFFEAKEFWARNDVPSYVDPVVIARALLGESEGSGKAKLPTGLQAIAGAVGETTDQMVAAVSHWVDSSLTVLSERFKRHQRWVTTVTALVVTVLLNLDTVALATHLYVDKEARDAVVAVAVDVTSKTSNEAFTRCYGLPAADREKDPACAQVVLLVDAVRGRNASLGRLPIGWGPLPPSLRDHRWPAQVGGWILTALALSLGAPFWFDLLGRFVNVRNGIRRPEVEEGLAASGVAAQAGAGGGGLKKAA